MNIGLVVDFDQQIPSYFTNAHLSGIQLALDTNHFKPVAFVRDYMATAMEYGYYPNLEGKFNSKNSVVLFVDMGAVSTTVTLVRYSKVCSFTLLRYFSGQA